MSGSTGSGEGFEAWLARRERERQAGIVPPTSSRRAPAVVPAPTRTRSRAAKAPVADTATRVDAIGWAVETMGHERTIFLDTETTGFGPRAEIIDIGIVSADGTVLLDTLVRPDGPIPAATSAVHGLYDHHVSGAPSWLDVYPEVYRLLTGARVVVYNAPFDSGMVTTSCQRSGVVIPGAAWHCAMRQYSAFAGPASPRPGRNAARWYKLDSAAAAFGVAPGGHRALADADVCRRVVAGMALTTD